MKKKPKPFEILPVKIRPAWQFTMVEEDGRVFYEGLVTDLATAYTDFCDTVSHMETEEFETPDTPPAGTKFIIERVR